MHKNRIVLVALLCLLGIQGESAMTTYPDDAYSRSMVDRLPTFEMRACSPGEGVFERASMFAVNEMSLVRRSGGWSTRWRIRSNGTDTASLSAECPLIRREPTSLSFRVRNNSAKSVLVKAQYAEFPWHPGSANQAVEWVLGEPQKVEPMTERTVEFRFADARWPDRTEPPTPRYPGVMRLSIQGLEKDADYELFLNDCTYHYPPAPGLQVTKLRCPPILHPGQKAEFAIDAVGACLVPPDVDSHAVGACLAPPGTPSQAAQGTPLQPGGRVIDLEVRREPWVVWRIRLTPGEIDDLAKGRCRVKRTVPFYLAPGPATVGLVADGYRADGPEAEVEIACSGRASVPASDVVSRHGGTATTCDGGFGRHGGTATTQSVANELPRVERRMYHGRPTLFVNGKPFPWTGYQSPDFQPGNAADFGRSGASVLTIQCDLGRYCPRPGVYDYGSVDEQVASAFAANPDAMIFLAINLRLPPIWDQTHEDQLVRINGLIWEEGIGNRAGSIASEEWYRDQELELRKLLRYCKAQPWASRLLGMWLMGEVTSEWFAWGSNDKLFGDYSQPNEDRFGAPIPPPSERSCPGYDFYPPERKMAAAYNQYYADLTSETICRLAKVSKEETGGRSINAVFFGYVIQLAGEFRGPIGGNFAVEKVLADPNVDVIGGVPLHNFRDFLNGYSVYISATESVLAAGKIYCDSNDLFSWLHPLHWYREYDPGNPQNGAIQMQRRETANNAVHGAGNEWFSLMPSWHHDAGLQADFARQIRVAGEALKYDRTPTEEIAFVVDGPTFAWSCPESEYLRWTNTQLLFHCGRTGAPVGVWLLSDLDRLPERIKLVVIACATAAKPEDIARLERLIEKGGRTIIVVGAPGLVNPVQGVWQPDAVSGLLGLPIQIEDASLPARMTLTDGTPITDTDATVRPRAFIEGEGFLRYSDGKSAGAERPLANGGRLIWCGIPPHSTALIRQWAQEAGVHFYAPQEYCVYSSRELVSVTSPKAGSVKLAWPTPVTIRDLFDGWEGSGQEIDCPFDPGQTRLFAVRPTGTS